MNNLIKIILIVSFQTFHNLLIIEPIIMGLLPIFLWVSAAIFFGAGLYSFLFSLIFSNWINQTLRGSLPMFKLIEAPTMSLTTSVVDSFLVNFFVNNAHFVQDFYRQKYNINFGPFYPGSFVLSTKAEVVLLGLPSKNYFVKRACEFSG